MTAEAVAMLFPLAVGIGMMIYALTAERREERREHNARVARRLDEIRSRPSP